MERKYKDSGIEWIGKIPETWEVSQLSNLFKEHSKRNIGIQENNLLSLSYGSIIRKDINDNGGLLPESFEGYNIIEKDDIVFRLTDLQNDKRSLRTGLVKERGIITSAYVTVRKRNYKNSSSYFHYLFHSCDECKIFYGLGAGVRQGMNFQELKKLGIVVPPLSEQQRIADYLDKKCGEIDSLIALQEQMIEKLKAYKQSVITEAVTKGLDPNAKLVPSGIDWIGDIPEGVKFVKLSMLTSKIGSGSTPRGGSSIYVKEGIKFLRSQNVYCEGFDLSDVAYITEDIDEEMSGTRVKVGDVLLNITGGSIGRCYYVDETLGRANVNQHVSIIRPTKIETKYLKYYLQSDCGQKQIALLQTGGNREGLSAAALSQFSIVYPPLSEQQAIASYLDSKCADIDHLIAVKQQKIEKLKDYKKSVIYEAVTGKTII